MVRIVPLMYGTTHVAVLAAPPEPQTLRCKMDTIIAVGNW